MRMNPRAGCDELSQISSFVPTELMGEAARFQLGEALVAVGFVAKPRVVLVRTRVTVEDEKELTAPLA